MFESRLNVRLRSRDTTIWNSTIIQLSEIKTLIKVWFERFWLITVYTLYYVIYYIYIYILWTARGNFCFKFKTNRLLNRRRALAFINTRRNAVCTRRQSTCRRSSDTMTFARYRNVLQRRNESAIFEFNASFNCVFDS